MKKFLLFIVTSLLLTNLQAQEYSQAVGIRGGISSGFEYRAFSNEYISYKALLSTRNHGVQLTGLKEFHIPDMFDFSDQLTFIYGFGAHVGYERWNVYDMKDYPYTDYFLYGQPIIKRRTGVIIGLDALAGVEYTFWEVPLSVGLEVKPYFNVFGKNFFRLQPFDFAFTVKYLF